MFGRNGNPRSFTSFFKPWNPSDTILWINYTIISFVKDLERLNISRNQLLDEQFFILLSEHIRTNPVYFYFPLKVIQLTYSLFPNLSTFSEDITGRAVKHKLRIRWERGKLICATSDVSSTKRTYKLSFLSLCNLYDRVVKRVLKVVERLIKNSSN